MQQVYADIAEAPEVLRIIEQAMQEDVGSGDHSSLSCIEPDRQSTAVLIYKGEGIAAGLSIAGRILKMNDPACKITMYKKDGSKVQKGDIGFEVEGNARSLMKSERLLLNIMQRLSGIATVTDKVVSSIREYETKVLDTRKTTPNLRILEKWAVTVGGGHNHRFGLFDMVLLKDNHIDVAGGIKQAVTRAKEYIKAEGLDLDIEVETRNLEEVKQVLEVLPVQRILLDNIEPKTLKQALELIDGRCETEASGGITLENIRDYAATGVDFISLGMLTHSVTSLDISFKIKL